jgi:hypothetical protein
MARFVMALLLAAAATAAAPTDSLSRAVRGEDRVAARPLQHRAPYDGRFTFVRVRYGGGRGGGGGFFGRGGFDAWAHDYPNADLNMQLVLDEVTSVHPVTGTSEVLDLEDPAIFQHPILYMSEPGFWRITPEGAQNLRTHLLKGGFIIFDDFDGPGHFESWEAQMRQALPEHRPIPIDDTHPVFRTFFFIEDIYVPHPMVSVRPEYLGIFEDNDPQKRMLALVNWNSDLAEYWEYAATGYLPIDPTNDAYRLGVNYFIWGLTH